MPHVSILSRSTLSRMSPYLDVLNGTKEKYISASTIAKQLGLGEVQVRKDLASVCSAGKPRLGYPTDLLKEDILQVLRQDCHTKAIAAGTLNMCRALLEYDGFDTYGIEISAAFDVSGTETGALNIFPMDQMGTYCQRNGITLGVLAVPTDRAQMVCDRMNASGITAILSLTAASLNAPQTVTIQQINPALSLAHLNMISQSTTMKRGTSDGNV